MKKVKEAEKWIQDANANIDKLRAEHARLKDVFIIRGDFIDHEQDMYPLQFSHLWKPI